MTGEKDTVQSLEPPLESTADPVRSNPARVNVAPARCSASALDGNPGTVVGGGQVGGGATGNAVLAGTSGTTVGATGGTTEPTPAPACRPRNRRPRNRRPRNRRPRNRRPTRRPRNRCSPLPSLRARPPRSPILSRHRRSGSRSPRSARRRPRSASCPRRSPSTPTHCGSASPTPRTRRRVSRPVPVSPHRRPGRRPLAAPARAAPQRSGTRRARAGTSAALACDAPPGANAGSGAGERATPLPHAAHTIVVSTTHAAMLRNPCNRLTDVRTHDDGAWFPSLPLTIPRRPRHCAGRRRRRGLGVPRAERPSEPRGGGRGTRTLGLFHAMEALYHLSYTPAGEAAA